MFTKNIFTQAYQEMLQEDRTKFTYKAIKAQTEEVLGEFKSETVACITMRDYTTKNQGVPVKVIRIAPDGTEQVIYEFIGTTDAKGVPHMSEMKSFNKREANKARFEQMAKDRADRRQASKDLSEKIKAIREEAAAKIAELKAEIEKVRTEANNKILALKGEAVATDTEATPAEAEDVPVDDSAEAIMNDAPEAETQI